MKKLRVFSAMCIILSVTMLIAWQQIRHTSVDGKQAEFSIVSQNEIVKKDEEVLVTIKVKSSIPMGKLEAYVSYNSDIVEIVESTSSAVQGVAGKLQISDQFVEETYEVTYTVTMKALAIGTSTISIEDCYVYDMNDMNVIAISTVNQKIEVIENKEESTDATLSELVIFPGTLDEPFNSSKFTYHCNVDHTVDELIMSAIPTQEDSVVEVKQPKKLVVGENKIVITVTSMSGKQKKYTIYVYKSGK